MPLRTVRRTSSLVVEASRVLWQVGAGIVDAARILVRGDARRLPTLSSRELQGYGLPGF